METTRIILILNPLLLKVEVELRYTISTIARKGFKDTCSRVKDSGFITVTSTAGA